ncbi:helix-turn-helix domain-containing protein [Aestuariivirga sp.]|uniref:helix-turn-helix domain-containing protein n=1 Tax=Aestuariivirga sp. TaxID=2650926 RepID=UPI003BAB3A68
MSKAKKSTAAPKYHSMKEVADILNISERSVQRIIASGVLPSHKFGATVRVADDDLRTLEARSRRVKSM